MVYTPPTLVMLRNAVAADLRDPGFKTFLASEVNALINGAVVEVSRVYPKDVIDSWPYDGGVADYPCQFEAVFRVEVFRSGAYWDTIPANESDDSAQGGFDLFGGSLHLPWNWVATLSETSNDSLRVWGYQPRDLFDTTNDNDGLDGDADTEHAVRVHAVSTGYQRLTNSRVMFQQWTQTGNNTDVSPNMLLGIAGNYESQWQRIRQQLRTLRRR